MPDRSGKKKTRAEIAIHRVPKLGYYIIVTDTKQTEKNYMEGLQKSIPKALQDKIVVKVIKKDTTNLLTEAIRQAYLNPQYGRLWIVFDRDQNKNFDKIIAQAEAQNIHVGWSNPCLEIWFHAYLGEMPIYAQPPETASQACCDGFGKAFKKSTKSKQIYNKNDPDIYQKLCKVGDEAKAIILAEQRFNQQLRAKATKKGKLPQPSQMDSCTTVHRLVKEIKEKI